MWATPETRLDQPRLDSAWLFYRNRGMFGDDGVAMVTKHDVFVREGKAPALGPGKTVDEKSIAQAFELIRGHDLLEHEHSGLLDANVLQFDSKKLTWFVPGKVRPMWYRSGQRSGRVDVAWPNLIFHYSLRVGFRIFATAAKRRPTHNTRLFHAPLGNIYHNASVCFGSAERGDLSLEGRAIWEEAIFDTRFSHVNQDHTLQPKACGLKGDKVSSTAHLRFWRSLERKKAKSFPAKALSPFPDGHGGQIKLGDALP